MKQLAFPIRKLTSSAPPGRQHALRDQRRKLTNQRLGEIARGERRRSSMSSPTPTTEAERAAPSRPRKPPRFGGAIELGTTRP